MLKKVLRAIMLILIIFALLAVLALAIPSVVTGIAAAGKMNHVGDVAAARVAIVLAPVCRGMEDLHWSCATG